MEERRLAKRAWIAQCMRTRSASETIDAGFSLSNFGAELREAARRARY
jgi:hypothetical protein